MRSTSGVEIALAVMVAPKDARMPSGADTDDRNRA